MSERTMLDTATRYRLLKLLEANPEASQRALARELGVSLGKVNYCLRALMDKGWVKARNFRNSDNKLAYLYVLTPKGAAEKARLTVEYLRIKLAEAEALEREIAALRAEAARLQKGKPETCS
ncbi:MarR family EPS-associated transcriptional regulator [Thiobacter aerophilum]|uniref:MarR family EPS-associated transcriptional regulator n=1 Tax=Thiobacter aerophilum TaxID=3121275 RepID=A0ABV0ED14_9BURK